MRFFELNKAMSGTDALTEIKAICAFRKSHANVCLSSGVLHPHDKVT